MGTSGMPSTEIVFWLALFGIDIGLPLMLPERFKFQAGAILVSLSTVAFFWSIGYKPSIAQDVSFRAFLVAVIVAGCASLIARLVRERDLASDIFQLADSISAYANALKERDPKFVLLPMKRPQWRRIVDKYNREYGKAAARIVRELSDPAFRQFANEVVTSPDSVKGFLHIAAVLTALADTSSKFRTKRLVKATI